MPRGAEPVGRVGVTDLAQLGLRPSGRGVNHLRTEHVAAEACIDVGLLPAQAVVHVQRGDGVAELL